MNETIEQVLILLGIIIAVPLYIWGAIKSFQVLQRKQYISYVFSSIGNTFSGVGCILWATIGWWAALIMIGIGLNILFWTFPFIWLLDGILPPRNICPSCKRNIRGDVSRCTHCSGEVQPVVM